MDVVIAVSFAEITTSTVFFELPDKDQTDNKDTTDEKKDENSSSGSASGGSSSTDTFETTPSELAKKGYSFKWGDDFTGTSLNRSDWNV